MNIESKHIGTNKDGSSKIIELIVSDNNYTISEDITLLDHSIDEDFIQSLKNLVDEFEEHYRLIHQ